MPCDLELGTDFAVVRKNTFLEVIPEIHPRRGRSTMSEPSRSRETTPVPMHTNAWDGSCNTSPTTTPMLSTRCLNMAPVWSPAAFEAPCSWSPALYEGQMDQPMQMDQDMEWAPAYDECPMYCVPNDQWVYYEGQPMQVQFVPFETCEGDYFEGCQDPAAAPTTPPSSTQNPSSAGSDTEAPAQPEEPRWREERTERRTEKKDKKRLSKRLSKPAGGKVFVGGLASKTTEETLNKVFAKYGTVAQANVLLDPASRRSRGFGYVTFSGEVPQGVAGRDHLIDGRLCGARLYKY